jgi:hypothetical protein
MLTIRIAVTDNATDDQLRSLAKRTAGINGEYIDEICRRCGSFTTRPDANTCNAKIVKTCRVCLDRGEHG